MLQIDSPSLAQPAKSPEHAAYEQVMRAIRDLRFGTVQITIHEGRVVEIQKTERIRPSCC